MSKIPETSTPRAKQIVDEGGAYRCDGVRLTPFEVLALVGHYGTSTPLGNELEAEGNRRSAFRRAKHDGLRLMAWLVPFLDDGEDPVRAVQRLAARAGWDVQDADEAWDEFLGVRGAEAQQYRAERSARRRVRE